MFDGYTNEPSTKDNAHLRRTAEQVGKCVNFVGDMKINLKKECVSIQHHKQATVYQYVG